MSNTSRIADACAALRALLGDRFSTDIADRDAHARDISHHPPQQPDGVVFPESTDEVAGVVRICDEHEIPVIPYGTGTAVEGGVIATRGGICIDLQRMNAIVAVNAADMDAVVQAGVTRFQLNDHLGATQTGLHFTVDPGADASIGGMAATCASGSSTVGYGTMRENVLGLTVVMPDGRVVRTGGRARKSSAGYDLTRLMVGSEGTLGIITEVIVRLHALPPAISAAVCPFSDFGSAVNCVIAILTSGINMARIELLDEVQIDCVNRYAGLDNPVAPTLFFEFHGTPGSVEEQARSAGEIVDRFGGGPFRWTADEAERRKLWQARYDSYYAAKALRDNGVGYVTDVCVPVSKLADCITRTREILSDTRIPCPLFGHVGDGNYHVVFIIDQDSESELAEVRELGGRIVDFALAAGGTCTGEHGIGLGKLDALEREYGDAVDVMRSIKRALDPKNIMNPGKVLRDV